LKQATEQNDLETALAKLPEAEQFLRRLMGRVAPFFPLRPPARVLDVGAAQGVATTAFKRLGFDALGVEPWEPAIEFSHELSRRTGVETTIRTGLAEELPFDSEYFDFLLAYSVMEHVDDPEAVFSEAYRVLKPSGAFFFSTTSALSPRQAEIGLFPLFPWYPPRLQRRLMEWAMENRPELVGHTTRPAYHWFKHREVRRSLTGIGFSEVVDRWQLRREEEGGRLRRGIIAACSASRPARLLGDIASPGMEYLAVKDGSGHA
jgi:2-polyprenyl-3-methyl-5-hydroxy-6-metoxy-1,4-benzoquinol methylase